MFVCSWGFGRMLAGNCVLHGLGEVEEPEANTTDRGGVINKRGRTLERMFWDEKHHIQRTMAN